MYEAQFDPKRYAAFKEYFPKSMTRFETILKGALK